MKVRGYPSAGAGFPCTVYSTSFVGDCSEELVIVSFLVNLCIIADSEAQQLFMQVEIYIKRKKRSNQT